MCGDGGIRRRGGGGGGGYRDTPEDSGLVRPKLELNIKVDREAEEERLKSLLRDDFIDDLKEGSFVPVQLPMIETGWFPSIYMNILVYLIQFFFLL